MYEFGERESGKARQMAEADPTHPSLFVCVYVCVRERERERMSALRGKPSCGLSLLRGREEGGRA
jgi:hypothetical protein